MATTTIVTMAVAYLALFAGRVDAYNRHTGSTYITVREALTPAVIVAAWTATPPTTVGAFFLTPENSCHVLAYDFDRPDGWDLSRQLGTIMWVAGAPAYVERSREGRAHLWATAEERLPGIVLRRAQRVWMADAGILATDADLDAAHIELRPAADRLSNPDSLGRALRLPGMPNPVTGEQHLFADPRTGEPIAPTVAAMLESYELVPVERLAIAAERYRPPRTPSPPRFPPRSPRYPPPASRYPRPGGFGRIERFNAENTATAVLVREFGLVAATPGRSVHCPGPAHRQGDRSPSLSVLPDDRRAYCHVPGCVFNGNGHGVDAFDLHRIATGALR